MTRAETLHCPTCGAAASGDAARCEFCGARLKTVACPRCFAMMFVGAKHCSSCGARAEAAGVEGGAAAASCPRCRVRLETVAVGSASLRECARCDGLWVDAESFERIVSEREEQSAVLGAAALLPKRGGEGGGGLGEVRYVPCPECGQLMNRVNFARCSGVVVDVCKGHGTWFDREELRRIVEFIRGGGLSVSREREKREVSEERRKLRQEQLSAALQDRRLGRVADTDDRRLGVVVAAGELLGWLLD